MVLNFSLPFTKMLFESWANEEKRKRFSYINTHTHLKQCTSFYWFIICFMFSCSRINVHYCMFRLLLLLLLLSFSLKVYIPISITDFVYKCTCTFILLAIIKWSKKSNHTLTLCVCTIYLEQAVLRTWKVFFRTSQKDRMELSDNQQHLGPMKITESIDI